MSFQPILLPLLAQVLLTFIVWVYMYVQRLSEISRKSIATQDLRDRVHAQTLLTESANSSNNLKNLFELPVIFYALCITLHVLQAVDSTFVTMAWAFVIFRALHSAIQCTINIVLLRFAAYLLSSLILFAMVVRFTMMVL